MREVPVETRSSAAPGISRGVTVRYATRHEVSHCAADTVVKLHGELAALLILFDPQIEQAALGPIPYNAPAAEQRDFVGVRHLAHRNEIGFEVNHRLGLTRELHIHQ